MNQLCEPLIAQQLLDAARFYHRERRWSLHLLVLMPDHLHAIVAVVSSDQLSETVRGWKRYTARAFGVRWQRDFFDHRVRAGESLEQKAHYIRENPVRAGLVARSADWPHVIDFTTLDEPP